MDLQERMASFLGQFGKRIDEDEEVSPDGITTLTTSMVHFGNLPQENEEMNIMPQQNSMSVDPNQIQLEHLRSVLKMKNENIQRLEAEVRNLIRIQNDQAKALRQILAERSDLEIKLKEAHNTFMQLTTIEAQNQNLPMSRGDTQSTFTIHSGFHAIENYGILRVFLVQNDDSLEEIINTLKSINEPSLRASVGQRMIEQTQKFYEIHKFYEQLIDNVGNPDFVSVFENGMKTIINCKRVVLWLYIKSAGVALAQTSYAMISDKSGLVGQVIQQKTALTISDPKSEANYSPSDDGPFLNSCENVLIEPVIIHDDVTWIMEIIDPLDESGISIPPRIDDMVIISRTSELFQKLFKVYYSTQESAMQMLVAATTTKLAEQNNMRMLWNYHRTVLKAVACEQLQIFFATNDGQKLFQITDEENHKARTYVEINNAGLAGKAATTKKIINAVIAKEVRGFNLSIDGEYPNTSILCVPLISSKGVTSVVAVARQKRIGMSFKENDELLLEALARLAQGSLTNAEHNEQNVSEIQKALANHRYFSALLAVAQELSSELEIEKLVHKIMTKAQQFINCDRCSLFLVDAVRQSLWSMVARGNAGKIYVKIGDGIAGTVAATGETINIPDAYQDSRFNPSFDKKSGYHTRSILCVPIFDREHKIIGVTQMINKFGGPFDPTDVELMSAFNVFCGIAITNAQLYENATVLKKQMSALLNIATSITTVSSLSALIQTITQNAKEIIKGETVMAFIVDNANNVCRPIGSTDNITDVGREDLISFVASTGGIVNTDDPYADTRFKMIFCRRLSLEVHCLMAVPIFDTSKQVTGVIEAVNKIGAPKFSAEDLKVFKTVASFTGLALQRWMKLRPSDFWCQEEAIDEALTQKELEVCGLPERLKIYEPLLSAVTGPEFDVLAFTTNDQYRFIMHCFEQLGLMREFKIKAQTLLNYLRAVNAGYITIPYHNWNRAVNTGQMVFVMLTTGRIANSLSKLELLALMVSALCVEIGRRKKEMGKRAQGPLRLLYRGDSVEEMLYCSNAIKAMNTEGANIISNLDAGTTRTFWELVRDLIFSSRQWKKTIDEVRATTEGTRPLNLGDRHPRCLLMRLILQACMCITLTRPYKQAMLWAGAYLRNTVKEFSEEDIFRHETKFCEEQGLPIFTTLEVAAPGLHSFALTARDNAAKFANGAK